MRQKQEKKFCKQPNLLRGLFTGVLLILISSISIVWSILTMDVEKLVTARTSEYAHSIAKIAANTSVKYLQDKVAYQLEILTRSICDDPYIQSATVFAEDGQVFAQYPQSQLIDFSNSNHSTTEKYLQSRSHLPYIEPIIHEQVTIGWFKIVIDQNKLESSYRASLNRTKKLVLLCALVSIVILFVLTLRFSNRVKNLVSLNHRLIQLNSPELPYDKKDWLGKIRELSETQFYQLPENIQLPEREIPWVFSHRNSNCLFCYCQFAMQEQEHDLTAQCLTEAEGFLQAAIQTHGLHSQGNILSGCLIPAFDHLEKEQRLGELLGLLHLLQELLASLPLQIKMRAFIGYGTILVLENNRAEVSGISLSNRLVDKINKLSPHITFGETICINFAEEELMPFGIFQDYTQFEQIQAFKLVQINQSIEQQVSRQQQFIKSK